MTDSTVPNFPSSWSTITDSFILSSDHRPTLSSDSELDDVPVISLKSFFDALGAKGTTGGHHDWSAIAASLPELSQAPLVSAIGEACAGWGFFQVVDHGVPPELLQNVKAIAKSFFRLPVEEKKRIGRSFDCHLGYNDSELTKNTRFGKRFSTGIFEGIWNCPNLWKAIIGVGNTLEPQ